ncbi:MAG: ABC transporter ATP-binding protein, partial [Anaerolineae bacterium]
MAHRHYSNEIEGKPYDARIMKRLLTYVRPYRLQVAAALALMSLVALSSLAGPYLIKTAIDEGIVGRNLALLGWAVLLYVAASLVQWVARFGQIYIMAWVGQSIIYTVRTQLFEHLQRLSLSFYEGQEIGKLMSRLTSDTGVLQELISWAIVAVASDILTLGGIVAVMVSMNARLSFLSLLVLPIMGAATTLWRTRARQSYRKVRAAIAQVNASLQENIAGVRVVQSFSREDLNMQRFVEVNRANLQANLDAAKLAALFFPTVDFVSALAVGLVIWYGGAQVLGGELTAGALVAFVLYINRFFNPIRDLSQRYNTLQATMAAGERIF